MMKLFVSIFVLLSVGMFGNLAWQNASLSNSGNSKTSLVVPVHPASTNVPHRDAVRFNRDIRPILSDNCFACHGPDAAQRQADLRLDTREDAIADLGGYSAIVPGKPDESELILRIQSEDDDERMPPAGHRKVLSESEKELLVRWIREGAEWEKHWSLIPPQQQRVPAIDSKWPRNAVDYFVLQRLQQEGIHPSPQADRRTLIRRLYFDLTGLPPSPEQVEAFENDRTPDAYEKVVDQLLDSRHFGERLAMYWLDLVRYADTVGYHGDQEISVSPYRDYVIEAFNSNMRFDQFTREQLAGDLLPNATRHQKIASGYNRLGMMSAEGGVQPEEYLVKYAADRVRTTASVWLGVTLGCAECHDHKFDPFSTREFYQFAAFFADIKERGLYSGANSTGDWGPKIDVPDAELAGLLKPLDEDIAKRENEIRLAAKALMGEQKKWEKEFQRSFQWKTLKPRKVSSYYNTAAKILPDKSILMTGKPTDEDVYFVELEPGPGVWQGVRLEALPHKTLPREGPGRAGNGNFVLTELIALRGAGHDPEQVKKTLPRWSPQSREEVIPLTFATATHEQNQGASRHPDKKWSAASAIDQDQHSPNWGWAILPNAGQANELVVRFKGNGMRFEQGEKLTLILQQYHGNGKHLLGRFRASITADENPVSDPLRTLPSKIRSAMVKPEERRSPEELQDIAEYFVSVAPQLEPQRKALADLVRKKQALTKKHTRTSLITVAVKPREIRVLPRGNWMDRSGPVVLPGTPKVLPSIQSEKKRLNRLDLANWLVDHDNPLTARVFVNRIWKLYFGAGIAKVLDDLGSQGPWPSHPQLLDFLAREFVSNGWDVKKLVRLLVTSATYRQASQYRDDLREKDPENRLWARQARFRIDAEMVRDNLLASSGLLVRSIGGRSVKPYQPMGLYRHLNFPRRTYQSDKGEDQYRRGLYTHWQRQYLHPAMKSFDAPPREECTCERPQSNTPLAALVMLNDPTSVEAARKLAEMCWIEESKGSDGQHVNSVSIVERMFQKALSRSPNNREREVLRNLHRQHLQYFRKNPQASANLNSIGLSPRVSEVNDAELAALTNVARAIFNMHEFITRF